MPNLQLFLQFDKVRITNLHGYAIGHYAETMALIECCVVAFFWHDVYVKVVSVMVLCLLGNFLENSIVRIGFQIFPMLSEK